MPAADEQSEIVQSNFTLNFPPSYDDIEEDNDYEEEVIEEPEEESDSNEQDSEGTPDSEPDSEPDQPNEWLDNLPDYLKPPSEFENEKEELEYYKDLHNNYKKWMSSEEFVEMISNNYEEALLKKEKEIDKILAIKEALEGNPKLAFKKYFGEDLANYSYPGYMTPNEINALVTEELVSLYGEDYDKKYDAAEAAENPKSQSAKMLAKEQELFKKYELKNAEIVKKLEQVKPPTEEKIKAEINKQYKEVFEPEGYSLEEYESFIEDVKQHQLTIRDMHYLVYFDDYLKSEYERGIEAGRKGITQDLKKAARTVTPKTETKKIVKVRTNGAGPQRFEHQNDTIYNALLEKRNSNIFRR